MDERYWNEYHAKMLAKVREKHYNKEVVLNLLFDACAECQGLAVGSADDMWGYARHIIGIWDSIMRVVEEEQ